LKGIIMKSLNVLLLASASLLGSAAMAEGPGNVFPWDKPGYVEPTGATVSRADVVAQTRSAMAAGEIVNGELSQGQLMAAQETQLSGKTRVQVVAETREAMRMGLIVNGERAAPVPTAEQDAMIVAAGLQARSNAALASKSQTVSE
jgi:Domain of unknown function (DUF4148)